MISKAQLYHSGIEDHLADGWWPVDTRDDSANPDGCVPFLSCWSSNHLSKAACLAEAAQEEWSLPSKTTINRFHGELCFTDEQKEKGKAGDYPFNTAFTKKPKNKIQNNEKCYLIPTEESFLNFQDVLNYLHWNPPKST